MQVLTRVFLLCWTFAFSSPRPVNIRASITHFVKTSSSVAERNAIFFQFHRLFRLNLTIGTCIVLIRKWRIINKERISWYYLPSSSSILDHKPTTERWNPVLTDMSINNDNHKLTLTLFFMIIVIPSSRTSWPKPPWSVERDWSWLSES